MPISKHSRSKKEPSNTVIKDNYQRLKTDFDVNQKRIINAFENFKNLKSDNINLIDLFILEKEWENIANVLESVSNTSPHN